MSDAYRKKGGSRRSRSGSGSGGDSAAELLKIERARDSARLRELKEGRKAWTKKEELKLEMKKKKYEEEVTKLEARRKSFERSDSEELARRQSEPDLKACRKKKKGKKKCGHDFQTQQAQILMTSLGRHP